MSDNPANTNNPGRPKDMAKRQAILEAAKFLFLSNGYANTSMDAVANAARVRRRPLLRLQVARNRAHRDHAARQKFDR